MRTRELRVSRKMGEWRRGRAHSVWRGGSFVLLVLCATLSLGVGPEGNPLVFVDEENLEMELSEAKEKGATVGVCNLGQTELAGIEARLVGFNFPNGGTDSAHQAMIIQDEPNKTLPSRECDNVSMLASAALDPPEGKYRGLLILSSDQTENVSRQIVIEKPAPEEPEKSVAVAAKPVTSMNPWPMILTEHPVQRDLKIRLRVSKGEVNPDNAKGLIGTLSGGPRPGYVRIIGNPSPPTPGEEDTTSLTASRLGSVQVVPAAVRTKNSNEGEGLETLPVRIKDLKGVGTYSGALIVDGESIETELLVTDHPLWLLLPLVIGLLIGWGLLALTRRTVPNQRLQRRAGQLWKRYTGGKKAFDAELGGTQEGEEVAREDGDLVLRDMQNYKPCEKEVTTYKDKFNRARKVYFRNNQLADTTATDFKELVKILESAEADARHLGDTDGLPKALKDLKSALEKFATFLDEEVKPHRDPALVESASRLLKGGWLAVGAATVISEQARAYTGLIDNWRKSYAKIKRYRLWALQLLATFEVTDPPEEHLKMLHHALIRMREAYEELLDARDASTLAELGAAEDLKEAYRTLSYLGAWYWVWEPPEAQKPRERRRREAHELSKAHMLQLDIPPADRQRILQGRNRQSVEVVAGWMDGQDPPNPKPEVEAEVGGLFSGAGILFTILLASFVTLLALVLQIYPTGAVGTLKDYLTAVVVGATSTIAVNFLQGPLAGVFTSLRSS